MEFQRLFTAIVPSPDAQETLANSFRATCDSLKVSGIRTVRQENLHCTLHFLGDTPESQLLSVVNAMQVALAMEGVEGRQGTLRLTAGGYGTFPSRGRPRVLYQSIHDKHGLLRQFQRRMAAEFRSHQVGFDDRPFRPHITVAYVKRRTSPGDLKAVANLAHSPAGTEESSLSFEVSRIHLVRSVRGPGGSVYESIHSVPVPPASKATSSGESALE